MRSSRKTPWPTHRAKARKARARALKNLPVHPPITADNDRTNL